MSIDEIVKILNQVSEEVSKIQSGKENMVDSIVHHYKLLSIAKNYPITSHVISRIPENIQYDYIAGLINLTEVNNSELVKEQQRLLIYRIAASAGKKINIEDCIARSMKIDCKFWDNLFSSLDSQTASCFAMDVLLLGVINIDLLKQKKYEEISDVLQMMNISKKEITILARVARTIAEQNFEQFTELIHYTEKIEYNYFLGYFVNIPYTSVVSTIENLKDIRGNVLVVNASISHYNTIIDFSEYKADSICLKKCSFDFIRGIKSISKKIDFQECCFDGNLFSSTEGRNIFGGTYSKCEENYTFIEGKNLEFVKSKFKNCKASKNLLNLADSSIIDCEFLECEGKELPCTYMFAFANTVVRNTKFIKCKMETSRQEIGRTLGGVLLLENGFINECIFQQCSADGDSGYGSYAEFDMQIVCASNSKIVGCNFDNCCCWSCDSSNKIVTSHILGLRSAKEENNTFIECSSYHYHYSKRGSSYNVGNM